MRIVIAKDVVRGFRRRALRRYPKEYMETVWGFVRGDIVYICALYPLEHDGKRDACLYTFDDIDAQQEDAADFKLEVIGTIHTHPDGGCAPSEDDWETSTRDGDVVSGICQILRKNNRRRCRVRFYTGDPLVPCLTN